MRRHFDFLSVRVSPIGTERRTFMIAGDDKNVFGVGRPRSSGSVVEHADVWVGEEDTVPLVAGSDFAIALRRARRRGVEVSVDYEGPVPALIARGRLSRRSWSQRPGSRRWRCR